MRYSSFISLGCYCLAMFGELSASSGAWNKTTGGAWDNVLPSSNWVTALGSGVDFPSGAGQVAGFSGLPTTAGTITSDTNITIGSLVFDTSTNIVINFSSSSKTLTFQNTGPAEIFSSGQGTNTILNTPLILNSDLDIFQKNNSTTGSLTISSNISGPSKLSLYGGASNFVSLQGTNSHTGGTFVYSGRLDLNSTTPPSIPGDITIQQSGTVTHTSSNQYSTTSNMTVLGGLATINNAQTLRKATIIGGQINGAGILSLNSNANALELQSGGLIGVLNLFISNGGSIDFTGGGTAYFQVPSSDFNSNTVKFNVTKVATNNIDLYVRGSFINGTFQKLGSGVIQADDVNFPNLDINEGTIFVQSSLNNSKATGPVNIANVATLTSISTFTAEAGVINAGTVAMNNPLLPPSVVGTFRLSGDYTQTSSGKLAIKAINPGSSDKLVVDSGVVVLNGTLRFNALSGATFNPGDQITVLENTNNLTPISGTFSSFVYELPPNLNAELVYNPFDVIVRITGCSSCPICPVCPDCPICPVCPGATPLPPSDFLGVVCKKYDISYKNQICTLKATWKASPSNNVVSYRIYKNKTVVATIPAGNPLEFIYGPQRDCCLKGYSIVSVNSDGEESVHVPLKKA